jgi:L-galactonate dehydratase
MATGAVVNAIWDLWGRYEARPVWQLVCEMSPEELVRVIDFRYIADVLTPEEALTILREGQIGKEERIKDALENNAVRAYTTSAGWLGYSDEKVRDLLKETFREGFKYFKLKVGGNIDDDKRKLEIARSVIGYDGVKLMVDANQVGPPFRDYLSLGVGCARSYPLYETTRSIQAVVY